MAKRVDLDAMIPREDFERADESYVMDLIKDFPLTNLASNSFVLKLLRKPDFQRETNHWSPVQVATFIASFVDSEVVPSLIFWKAPRFIFVIDGGHRLSALRAWMEDDYGDGAISREFFGEITEQQKAVARLTRGLVEKEVGRYTALQKEASSSSAAPQVRNRANTLLTRALPLQWIQGSSQTAETSFYKINKQGTPLDETEEKLIRNRHKPVAIGARAIMRAGSGHKYWSSFPDEAIRVKIEATAKDFHERVFKPELKEPLKTLELPLGGSVSPVDALALLLEFLSLAGSREKDAKPPESYLEDSAGPATLLVLRNSLEVLNRISGNDPQSLGLHPAVYFYNEKGKYARFLFLGMVALIREALIDNNGFFFFNFTRVRRKFEDFLVENKANIALIVVNLSKKQRVSRVQMLLKFLVAELQKEDKVTIEQVIGAIGLRGRVVDIGVSQTTAHISDETKSSVTIRHALASALRCPICGGLLDPAKSLTYDHIVPVREGGTGDETNVQPTHPYCNTGYKERVAHKASKGN